jgi:quinol monooxygenase YgiN
MVVIMGTVRIDPARLAGARLAMEAMVTASRAEPGCRHYAYAEDLLEPGLIQVSEHWLDRDAVAFHFATPHMAAWHAQMQALGLYDRNLQIFDAGEPQPL